MSKQVIKQALDNMACMRDMVAHPDNLEFIDNAIASLNQAIAETEKQEPVAYFNPQVKDGFYWAKPTKITAPITVSVEPIPFYTTPQQRTWVDLTDEEVNTLWDEWKDAVCLDHKTWAQAIRAKLKEKNT